MKCRKCGQPTKVTKVAETKKLSYRERKCQCGFRFVTKERVVVGPVKWPQKPKPKKEPKEKPKPFGPAMEQWNIPVTKDSPEWLKKIALSLG